MSVIVVSNRVARIKPDDLIADRRYEFARDLQLRGDLPAAADLLEQAIELAPGFVSAWFTLGEIREGLGEKDAALSEIQRAQQLLPESKDAFEGPEITAIAAHIHAMLEDAAGAVSQPNQSGQAPAGKGAVGSQHGAAIDHRDCLAAHGLADGAVVGHKEAAFADVALRRRRCESAFAKASA